MTDHIVFGDNEYPVRDVRLSDYKVDVKVSTEALDAALFDQEKGYTSREAELIDEFIFFYVPDEMINAPEKELDEYICEHVYTG